MNHMLTPAVCCLLQLAAGVSISMLQGLISSVARPLVLRYIINEVSHRAVFLNTCRPAATLGACLCGTRRRRRPHSSCASGPLLIVTAAAEQLTPRAHAGLLVFFQLEDDDLTIDEIVTSLVALGLTVFVEGWLGVLFRHLLSEDLGTSFLTATFSLLLDKITVLAAKPNADNEDDKGKEFGTNDIANLLGNDIMKVPTLAPARSWVLLGALGCLHTVQMRRRFLIKTMLDCAVLCKNRDFEIS